MANEIFGKMLITATETASLRWRTSWICSWMHWDLCCSKLWIGRCCCCFGIHSRTNQLKYSSFLCSYGPTQYNGTSSQWNTWRQSYHRWSDAFIVWYHSPHITCWLKNSRRETRCRSKNKFPKKSTWILLSLLVEMSSLRQENTFPSYFNPHFRVEI